MDEKKNFNIKGIYSVALISPDKNEKRKRYDRFVPRYQLIYKISGEVITHFDKKTVRIVPGMVYIIPKSTDADYYIERTEVGDCIDIFFDTDYSFLDELICFDFSADKKMEKMFRSAYKMWCSKSDGYYYKVMATVFEILYKIVLKCKKYTPNYKYEKIETGVSYLQNHLYDSNIDYCVPSKICGISYTYFKKLFVEKFGVPPVKYVTDMRLEHAEELLMTNRYSVNEISKLCGFENIYYFSKKFKEKYEYAPTVYKKMQKF